MENTLYAELKGKGYMTLREFKETVQKHKQTHPESYENEETATNIATISQY